MHTLKLMGLQSSSDIFKCPQSTTKIHSILIHFYPPTKILKLKLWMHP